MNFKSNDTFRYYLSNVQPKQQPLEIADQPLANLELDWWMVCGKAAAVLLVIMFAAAALGLL